ncbi:MAG: transposase [Ignavibacteriaceae bacterium]|jgi:REP element-mobilizing transposase RayT
MEERHFHRRNLPHLYYNDGTYFITYRLFGSMPNAILSELNKIYISEMKIDLNKLGLVKLENILNKYEELLNRNSYLPKYLSDERIAKICQCTIHYYDENQYKLICYCIMPNHIHLIFKLIPNNKGISKIMQSIKRTSASESNKVLDREGIFWQAESFDRLIRDDKELYFTINYVLENPVKAGLIDAWEKWRYTYINKDYL